MATIDDILDDRKVLYDGTDADGQMSSPAPAQTSTQVTSPQAATAATNPDAIPAVQAPAAQKAVVQSGQMGTDVNGMPVKKDVQPTSLSYTDMMDILKKNQEVLTSEEQKRKKREAIISAIGSGISAISNLYTASTGGLDVYDPGKNTTTEHKSRWDKLQKEREKANDDYLNLQMRALKYDRDSANAERTWQNTLAQQRQAAEDKEREYNRRVAKDEADNAARAAAAAAKAEVDAANAARKDRELEIKEKTAQAQRSKYYAEIQRIKSATSGSGNKKTITYDIDGEKFEVPAANMSDPVTIAKLYNMLDESVRKEVGEPIYDISGTRIVGRKPATTKDMQAAIGVHLDSSPALQNEIRALAGHQRRPQKKANPMGGGSSKPASGKKKNPMN